LRRFPIRQYTLSRSLSLTLAHPSSGGLGNMGLRSLGNGRSGGKQPWNWLTSSLVDEERGGGARMGGGLGRLSMDGAPRPAPPPPGQRYIPGPPGEVGDETMRERTT
jgi:hypothetical protein